jgi:hypothetical protein
MAAGCLVVGYQGCGGAEFFDSTTGIPVIEDNTTALVTAVEEVVGQLSADGCCYDSIRAAGTKRVHERYGQAFCRTTLFENWRAIDQLMG